MTSKQLAAVLVVVGVAVFGTGCSSDDEHKAGGRTFEPARVLVQRDGTVILAGIARRVGHGFECGGEQKERVEFVGFELRGAAVGRL